MICKSVGESYVLPSVRVASQLEEFKIDSKVGSVPDGNLPFEMWIKIIKRVFSDIQSEHVKTLVLTSKLFYKVNSYVEAKKHESTYQAVYKVDPSNAFYFGKKVALKNESGIISIYSADVEFACFEGNNFAYVNLSNEFVQTKIKAGVRITPLLHDSHGKSFRIFTTVIQIVEVDKTAFEGYLKEKGLIWKSMNNRYGFAEEPKGILEILEQIYRDKPEWKVCPVPLEGKATHAPPEDWSC